MNKVWIFSVMLSLPVVAIAQNRVGVNTPSPEATLDVQSSAADLVKGVLVPRVSADEMKAMTQTGSGSGVIILLQPKHNSLLTFLKEEMPLSYREGGLASVDVPGYYYWNSQMNQWQRLVNYHDMDLRKVGENNHITKDAGVGGNGLSSGTGKNNIGIGKNALNAIVSGDNNMAIGENALRQNTASNGLIAIGANALRDNTTGANNMALGNASLVNNTTGSGNIAMGTNASRSNTVGANNVAIGLNALYANKEGNNNVAIGIGALNKTTVGNNVSIGPNTLTETFAR